MSHATKPACLPGPGSRSPRASAKLRKLHEPGDINSRTEDSHSPRRFHSRTQAATTIRASGPADMEALGDFFAGLSTQTRYLRFFAPVRPTPAMLRVLSGCDAHVDALVAVRDGVIIGHAMAADQPATEGPPSSSAARDPQRPSVTDIGVVVADAWQGRGVGSALVRALVTRAQARGVRSMTMEVLHANRTVLGMIERRWPAAEIGHCRESAAIHVQLPPPPAAPVRRCRFEWR